MTKLTTAYISHGGGPLPLLGDSSHTEMVTTLQQLVSDMDKPDLIIVVSAHWEAPFVSVQSNATPELYYDYYGFPDKAYKIAYPAKGNTHVAEYICETISQNGIASQLEGERGYDHGMFVPLKIMYPNADIPCIQVSLKQTLEPKFHLTLGNVLREAILKSGIDNVLLLGSGSSFHNMSAFFKREQSFYERAAQFDLWLQETMTTKFLENEHRLDALIHWQDAPEATFAHPREEHLLPLHVCYGANQRAADKFYRLTLLDKPASMFLWQHS